MEVLRNRGQGSGVRVQAVGSGKSKGASRLAPRFQIRVCSIEAAAEVTTPSDDIGNLLVHAGRVASCLMTRRLPEVEMEQLSIAGSVVQAA